MAAQQFDVVVVGAGPAGAATTIACRMRGLSVLMVDRSDGERTRPGEHLAGSVRVPLSQLGVWSDFAADAHQQCTAVYSAWGSGDLEGQLSLADPHGSGWLVDRRRFDASLCAAARESEALVLHDTRLEVRRGFDGIDWRLVIRGVDREHHVRARLLVDATGRRGTLAVRLGAQRLVAHSATAVAAMLDPRDLRTTNAPVVLVESTPEGWWYSAPIPDGRLVATFVTERPRGRRAPHGVRDWSLGLQSAPHTSDRVSHHVRPARVASFVVQGSILDHTAGHGWLAVGDAAIALDPLSGAGIESALHDGIAAASSVASALAGDDSAMVLLDAERQRRFRDDLDARRQVYEREQRWPHSYFWRQPAASPPSGWASAS